MGFKEQKELLVPGAEISGPAHFKGGVALEKAVYQVGKGKKKRFVSYEPICPGLFEVTEAIEADLQGVVKARIACKTPGCGVTLTAQRSTRP